MNLWNLQRDQTHIVPSTGSGPGWNGFASLANSRIFANSSGVVQQIIASENQQLQTIGGANWYASGLLIARPGVDASPFRVKVSTESFHPQWLVMGYAPASPTGTNDQIDLCTFIPVGTETYDTYCYDDVIRWPAVLEGDPYYDRALFFGLITRSYSNHITSYHLSVQNITQTPPQYAASAS